MKLFFLILSIIILSSCGNNYENYLRNNTSEIRKYICVGERDGVNVSLTMGKREKTYIVNGYSTELTEFGVLSFRLSDDMEIDKNACKYVLFVGTDKYEGDLQINPFDGTLVADIMEIVEIQEKMVVTLVNDSANIDIELKCVNENWRMTSEDVYTLVAKKMKAEISAFVVDNTFEGEVYIKIINDEDKNKSDYYWYVNIIGRSGKRVSAIISIDAKEILAKNSYL